MNEKKCVEFLNKFEEDYAEYIKQAHNLDQKAYRDICKTKSAPLDINKYKVIKGHTVEEYFKKFKYVKERKVMAFQEDELWLMDRNKEYWLIKNDSKDLYFEVPSKFIIFLPFFIAGAAVLAIGGLVGGIVAANATPGMKRYILKIEMPTDSGEFNIVGLKNNYVLGDKVELKLSPSTGFKLPASIDDVDLKITGDTDDVSYVVNNDGTATLKFTFVDTDINICCLPLTTSQDYDYLIYWVEGDTYYSMNEFRDEIDNMDDTGQYKECYGVGQHYELTRSADFTEDNWETIALQGYYSTARPYRWFAGSFDGKHHSLSIQNQSIGTYDDSEVGFFGGIFGYEEDNQCYISNLTLNVDLKANSNEKSVVIGGLTGDAGCYVTIENVVVNGSINSSRVCGGLIGNFLSDSTVRPTAHATIKECTVNADVSSFTLSAYGNDNWLCTGGIVGQNDLGNPSPTTGDTSGLYINDCTFNGKLSADFTNHTTKANPYMGVVFAKGGASGGKETTYINNFTNNQSEENIGYYNQGYAIKHFEGFDSNANAKTYGASPNPNKVLVGGYFCNVIIDGVTNPGSTSDPLGEGKIFPHGS